MTSGVLNGKCKFSERKIEAIGLVIFVLGCVMSFDWSAFFAISRAGLIAFEAGSTIFVAFGFTFAFTMQPSLYSKLIINHDGGRLIPKMGHYMARLSMAASAAKISGPILVGYGLTAKVDAQKAINILVLVVVGLVFVSAGLVLLGWSSLYVPPEQDEDSEDEETGNDTGLMSKPLRQSSQHRRDSSFARIRGASSWAADEAAKRASFGQTSPLE